jgi:hypothetical protein
MQVPRRTPLSLKILRTSPVKWTLFVLADLLDIGATVLLLDYTLFRWSPPNPIPEIGVAPIIAAGAATVFSFASLIFFAPSSSAGRLLALISGLSFAFALLCLWLVRDYPRAYHRFIHRQSALLRENVEQMACEHQQQEKL